MGFTVTPYLWNAVHHWIPLRYCMIPQCTTTWSGHKKVITVTFSALWWLYLLILLNLGYEAEGTMKPLLKSFLSSSSSAPFILVSGFTWKALINHKGKNSSVNVFVHMDTSIIRENESKAHKKKNMRVHHSTACDLHITRLNYISEANNMYFLIIRSFKIT